MTDLRATRWRLDDGGVGTLTLARPERLNAWTDTMAREVVQLLVAADADPGVRLVVVTGEGRGFCAGADFKALDHLAEVGGYASAAGAGASAGSGDGGGPPTTPLGRHPALMPLEVRKPVLAAVNGPVAGIGFVLLLACDLRIGAADAKLTTSFARLGLPAEHAVSWLLPRVVGLARAADLLLSSRVVLGEEARALGILNDVLPATEVLEQTTARARAMAAACSPVALATIKAQLLADASGSFEEAATTASRLVVEMTAGPDFAEAVAARAAGRSPSFPPLPPPPR